MYISHFTRSLWTIEPDSKGNCNLQNNGVRVQRAGTDLLHGREGFPTVTYDPVSYRGTGSDLARPSFLASPSHHAARAECRACGTHAHGHIARQ